MSYQEQDSYNEQKAPLRIAVFISGAGSNLQALIDAIENRQLLGVEIVLVVSNKANAYGLQRALDHKLPAIYLPWKPREEAEVRALALMKLFQVDLIVLAGWLRIFSADFIEQFPFRMINLHPALLPEDGADIYITSDGSIIPALRGLHVVRRAIDANLRITGSTVHYVISEVDAGPVISHTEVPIRADDTEETLHERLKEREHQLVVEAVRKIAQSLQITRQK
jgi:phosphoribosylglycinamide formyltransferase-1